MNTQSANEIRMLLDKTLTSRRFEASILANEVAALERDAQALMTAARQLNLAVNDNECEDDVARVPMFHRLNELEDQLKSVKRQYTSIREMDTLIRALYAMAGNVDELADVLPNSKRAQPAEK